MSISKNYPRWIKGLTKEQFDELIKVFVHLRFDVEISAIVDGPGDGGIDIKIFENERAKKIPIQITINQTVYGKLEEDLEKISRLVEKEAYSTNFFFFYSGGAAEEKENKIRKKALEEYDLNLEIIDAEVLGGFIQTPKYELVREKLKNQLGEVFTESESYFDEFDKMKFDLISYGSDSVELKSRFIDSFILHSLLKAEGRSLHTKNLRKDIQKRFGEAIDEDFCLRRCENLERKKQIEIIGSLREKIKLSDEAAGSLQALVDEINLQEKEYLSSIESIVKDHLTDASLDEVMRKIQAVLKASYIKDQKEIQSDSSYVNGDHAAIASLRSYLSKHITEEDNLETVVLEIRKLTASNDFLQKICAGDLFKSLIGSEEFDAYQRKNNKSVIVDTPVLIYLLCAMHDRTYDYDNNRFKVAVHLFKLIRGGEHKLKFITTENYAQEAANHLLNAIKLIPSIELGLYDFLGGASNTFHQFHSDMVSTGYTESTFAEFIKEFGIHINGVGDDELLKYIEEYLIQLLQDNSVTVVKLHDYHRDPETQKDYEKIKKELETIYNVKKLNRSQFASKNDSLMLSYLYDEDIPEDEEQLNDPTLLTWDGSFSEFRRKFHSKHPSKRYWHLFRPSKFLDHQALLNFKIDSEAITIDLISITQDEFDLSNKLKNLNEILNRIVDMRTAEGTKLTTGLADIRREYIYQLKGADVEKSEFHEHQPIDDIMLNISNYFSGGKSKNSIDTLKNSLKIDAFIQEFLSFISEQVEHFHKNQKYGVDIPKEMDKMIDEVNKE